MAWDICPAATRITQGYGCTDYSGEWYAPWCADSRFHAGVDLAADNIHGQPVYATRAGTIVANQDPSHPIQLCPEIGGGSVYEPYLGTACVILEVNESGRTLWIEYGHLDSAAVEPGQIVQVGDLLGYVGTHGASCGDHLHVEVRTDGPWQGVDNQAAAVLNPEPYLTAQGGFLMALSNEQQTNLYQAIDDIHGFAIRRDQTLDALLLNTQILKGILANGMPLDQDGNFQPTWGNWVPQALQALKTAGVDVQELAAAIVAKLPPDQSHDPQAIATAVINEIDSRLQPKPTSSSPAAPATS